MGSAMEAARKVACPLFFSRRNRMNQIPATRREMVPDTGLFIPFLFHSTLKNDLVHERDYQTREEARAEIFEFIEVFYNRQRLHQTLGYVSPEQFETQNPVPLRGCLRNRG